MDSRERFEEIRRQVVEIAKAEAELAALRETLGARTQRYSSTGGRSGSDPTDRIDAIIDRQEVLDVAKSRTNAEIEKALVILYGEDGRGGVAKERGTGYADAVCSVYLMGNTHQQTAKELGCSRAWVTNMCSEAFRWMDRRKR